MVMEEQIFGSVCVDGSLNDVVAGKMNGHYTAGCGVNDFEPACNAYTSADVLCSLGSNLFHIDIQVVSQYQRTSFPHSDTNLACMGCIEKYICEEY